MFIVKNCWGDSVPAGVCASNPWSISSAAPIEDAAPEIFIRATIAYKNYRGSILYGPKYGLSKKSISVGQNAQADLCY